MVNLTIDGMGFQAKEGSTLLEVARENGIEIPTLCYNEALGPEGRCRLCMVEIKRGSRTRLVTSCLYPVEEGLQVQTHSEKVLLTRKMVVELLLARCPDAEEIQKLAAKMGVEEARFKPDEGNWEMHTLRALREGLRRSRGGQRHRARQSRVGEKEWGLLTGTHRGLHRLRRVPFYLPYRRHPDDRKRRPAQHLGPGLQNGGLHGVRQLFRSRVPAGVDGQDNRRFPRFPQDLPELPEIESHIAKSRVTLRGPRPPFSFQPQGQSTRLTELPRRILYGGQGPYSIRLARRGGVMAVVRKTIITTAA